MGSGLELWGAAEILGKINTRMKDATDGTPARRELSPKVQMAAQGSETQIQLPPSWPGETNLSAASRGLQPRLLSGQAPNPGSSQVSSR